MDSDLDMNITLKEFVAFYKKYEPTISDKTVQKEFDFSDFDNNGIWTKQEVCEGFIETRSIKVGELNDGQNLLSL
jgi:Ca2+-binding EF-hand superfamily protein